MHSKEVQRMLDVDILLSNVLKHSEYSLEGRPNVTELMRIYCDSIVREEADFELHKGSIAMFMKELIDTCSEEKARYVLDRL